ncbi:MAG: filamentous hemagglutinin N-terminal domain-containing protein, partial [Candidatus Omnitrophica bacterium]|nr:filamentous hemagglutinin N-terminal domain-containing protein [Candidatus Omnitrophota bacterium]
MKKFIKTISLLTSITFAWTSIVYPLPQDIEIVAGSAEVMVEGSTMVINAADGTIINYSSFDIGAGENVIINLPDASSEILNRVIGGDFTTIAGSLQSNGICILINESGIYIAPSGTIDAAGLILATRDISNQDFVNGEHIFKKISTDEFDSLIKNSGTITLTEGGFGVLVSGAIENDGTIIANIGRIELATGEAVRIDIADGGLISVAIEKSQAHEIRDKDGNRITDQIKNTGNIQADGGIVMFKAESLSDIFEKAINLDGVVSANAFDEARGLIKIESNNLREYENEMEFDSTASVEFKGELKADTGEIHVDANHGGVYNTGIIDTETFNEQGYTFKNTGTLLGGEYSYDNIDGAAHLADGSQIGANQSDIGNLIVDGTITLLTNVTMTADSNNDGAGVFYMQNGTSIIGTEDGVPNDLTIISGNSAAAGEGIDGLNARLETITDVGKLELKSSTGSTAVYESKDPSNDTWEMRDFRIGANTKVLRFTGSGTGADNPYMIYDAYGLQAMQGYLDKYFKLAQDIDASTTAGWNDYAGFDSVGAQGTEFTGTLDGNNKEITNLYINRPNEDYVGLFGYTDTATIINLGLTDNDITGRDYTAGIVAYNDNTD